MSIRNNSDLRQSEADMSAVSSCGLIHWYKREDLPTPQTIGAAKTLFVADEPVRHVYLISEGFVKLKCLGGDGREMIVGIRSSGWFLGADSALTSKPFFYTAVTLTKCSVCIFPRSQFLQLMQDSISFRDHIHIVMGLEIQAQMAVQVGLRSESAEERLEMLLDEMHSVQKAGEGSKPLLSQVEMSQLLAITPEHLCRILGRKRKRTSISGVNFLGPKRYFKCFDSAVISAGYPSRRNRGQSPKILT